MSWVGSMAFEEMKANALPLAKTAKAPGIPLEEVAPEEFAASIRRMEAAGAVITSTNSLMAEPAKDWSSEHGSKAVALVMERMSEQ